MLTNAGRRGGVRRGAKRPVSVGPAEGRRAAGRGRRDADERRPAGRGPAGSEATRFGRPGREAAARVGVVKTMTVLGGWSSAAAAFRKAL